MEIATTIQPPSRMNEAVLHLNNLDAAFVPANLTYMVKVAYNAPHTLNNRSYAELDTALVYLGYPKPSG